MHDPSVLLLTVDEAGRRLSLGRTSVYALIRTGELPSVSVGRNRRIPATSLETFVSSISAAQPAA